MAPRFSRGRDLGPEGERAALAYLEARGLKLLARSVRTPWGEIDLVLEDARTSAVVICEVMARAGRGVGGGAESVTRLKQLKLGRAALHFVEREGLADRALRFDVVALETDARGAAAIRHFPDAFQFDGEV